MERVTFFCIYLVEGVTSWQYFNAAFARKRHISFAAFLFILGYSSAFLLFQLSTVWQNVAFFTLLNIALLKFLFTCSWKKCIFHSLMLTGLMLGSELLVNFFLGSLFGGADKYQTSLPFLVFLSVISKLIYFLSTKICLSLSRSLPSDLPDTGPTILLLASFSFSTIFVLVIMAYLTLFNKLTPTMETLMSIAALILLLSDLAIFAVYQYSQKLNRDNLNLQLLQQKDQAEGEYFIALENQYERQRVLLHDLRRHLTVIKEFALENGDLQVVHYVSDLQNLPALQRKVKYCGNIMLNVVLSRYEMIDDPDLNIRALACYARLQDIFGDLADYGKDVPGFTEEELKRVAAKQFAAYQTIPEGMREEQPNMSVMTLESLSYGDISLDDNQEYTIIPAYNLSGGITANITTFAAINRNTRHPDEAFKIVDYLLSPRVQQTSPIFQDRMEGLPVYVGTGGEDTPSSSAWKMNEANFKQISEAQKQINIVKFPGPLDLCLWQVEVTKDDKVLEKSAHEQYVLMKMLLAES